MAEKKVHYNKMEGYWRMMLLGFVGYFLSAWLYAVTKIEWIKILTIFSSVLVLFGLIYIWIGLRPYVSCAIVYDSETVVFRHIVRRKKYELADIQAIEPEQQKSVQYQMSHDSFIVRTTAGVMHRFVYSAGTRRVSHKDGSHIYPRALNQEELEGFLEYINKK